MPNKKIMVIDLITDLLNGDGNLIGKLVIDKAGNELKVKKGQGGKLASRWEEFAVGLAYEFDIGKYTPPGKSTSYDYVQDFRKVDNVFVKEAQKQVIDVQIIAKNKSVSASYAKDLVIAGEIKLADMLAWADVIYRYMVGELTIKDEIIVRMFTGGRDETTKVVKDNKVTDEPSEEGQVPGQDSGEAIEPSDRDEQSKRIRDLLVKLGWVKTKKADRRYLFEEYLKNVFGVDAGEALTQEQLDNLEGDLQVRVKST